MKEPPITDAERLVMEAVWTEAPLSSAEIIKRVSPAEDWSPKTVQTLIGRLVGKKMLARERSGRGYLYRPAIRREAFVASKSRSLVQRLFSGRITPLVAAFADSDKLDHEDLRQLKALVDELERKQALEQDHEHDD